MIKRKAICFVLCVLLLAAALSGCFPKEYESYTLLPNEFLLGETLSEGGELIYGGGDSENRQLTAQDISDMNDGDCYMVFNDEGYLTFLKGTYYDGVITDHENAIESLWGIQELLGISKGSEFYSTYGQKDSKGYTYYTYQQRYGGYTVTAATLRIIVDPNGHTAGLACSFTPNLGIAEEVEWISAQQAEDVIRATYPKANIYPEYTTQVSVTIEDRQIYAWAVYSDHMWISGEATLPYLEHLVSYDGYYIDSAAVSVPTNSTQRDQANAYVDERANALFEGMTPDTYTGTVTRIDGTVQSITVPTAYDPKADMYYLMDVERKIAAADYYSFDYQANVVLQSSPDNSGWENDHLLAYNNYIQAYDFYANLGIYSTDGTGTPILVLCDYADRERNPVDNACSMGIKQGFACFGASAAMEDHSYSEALDVCVHEFTHGVTGYSMGGNVYMNATGAINEAYSDIMGNIAEMSLDATYDKERWLIGEMSGYAMRCMSDPNAGRQPSSVSDPYYQPPIPKDKLNDREYVEENDKGGVHINNSLLSQVAYKLWKAGMHFDEQAKLWLATMEYVTPLAEYREIYGCLLMAFDIYQVDKQYYDVVTDAFLDAGLITEREAVR